MGGGGRREGGGMGMSAIQIAKLCGARVIAAASDDDDKLKGIGRREGKKIKKETKKKNKFWGAIFLFSLSSYFLFLLIFSFFLFSLFSYFLFFLIFSFFLFSLFSYFLFFLIFSFFFYLFLLFVSPILLSFPPSRQRNRSRRNHQLQNPQPQR